MSEIETSASAKAIIRAVMALSKSLDIPVLAEGIETESVAKLLRQFGCEVAQGWHFAHAMAEAELIPWLAQHAAVPA